MTKQKNAPVMRQIIIETDGNNINLAKAEVFGVIECIAILREVISFVQNQAKNTPQEEPVVEEKAEIAGKTEPTKLKSRLQK